jgi:methyltransferase (TIGR00027 family)
MEKDRPSISALRVAMSRAAHQLFDHPRLLDDPLALRVIGAQRADEIRADRHRYESTLARYLRAFLVARSRIAEDALAAAVGRGVRQYLILGAGLDTFAYRNPYPASTLRVFEVDHPATQAWKRRQLATAGIAAPQCLTFVPIDFETQTLGERLREVGFRSDELTFFSWLGVSMYLRREAVMGTLKYAASAMPRGSAIVLDYAVSPETVGPLRRLIARRLMRRVAAAGEPWKTFFDPRTLSGELKALGFAHTDDCGPEELNARFFAGRGDKLRVGGLAHVMSART